MSIKKKLNKKPISINKKELIRLTKDICLKVNKIPKEKVKSLIDLEKTECVRTIELAEGIFYFDQVSDNYLKEAVKSIKNDPQFKGSVSREKIEREYENLILKLSINSEASNEKIAEEVDIFLSELRQSIREYRIMIPIERLKLVDLDKVEIGSVRLAPYSHLEKEFEISSIFIRPEDKNMVYGDVVIKAELGEAYSKAQREIERVINLLRIYIPILFHSEYNKKIGLHKYDVRSQDYIAVSDHGSLTNKRDNLGPFGDYDLNKKRLDSLESNWCLNEMREILSKEPASRSELEKSIIMAIRWLGLGIDDDVISDKFLKYSIALECLLIKRGQKDDKTGPISERAAYILGRDPKDCREIESEVKILYDIRSAIVHQGCEADEEEIIEGCLRKIRDFSIRILLYMSTKTKEWSDIDDLVCEIVEKKYARPIDIT